MILRNKIKYNNSSSIHSMERMFHFNGKNVPFDVPWPLGIQTRKERNIGG